MDTKHAGNKKRLLKIKTKNKNFIVIGTHLAVNEVNLRVGAATPKRPSEQRQMSQRRTVCAKSTRPKGLHAKNSAVLWDKNYIYIYIYNIYIFLVYI